MSIGNFTFTDERNHSIYGDHNITSYNRYQSTTETINLLKNEFMINYEQKKLDLENFRKMISVLSVLLVSFGVFTNLLFKLVLIIQRRCTITTLIMVSMCLSNILFLFFFYLRVSIYFDDISKYHIYGTIEPWSYGLLACQIANSLNYTCKFISRLSIILLSFNHLINILKTQFRREKGSLKRNRQYNYSRTVQGLFFKLLDGPIILFLIFITWFLSISASFPIFKSFKLSFKHDLKTNALCDRIFDFAEDSNELLTQTANYIKYGFVIPMILTFVLFAATITFSFLCKKSNSNTKVILNWIIFILICFHIISSLPQELYTYYRLKEITLLRNTNENSSNSFDLLNIVTSANDIKYYYYIQLLYMCEFVITPIFFILYCFLIEKLFQKQRKGTEKCCIKIESENNIYSLESVKALDTLLFQEDIVLKNYPRNLPVNTSCQENVNSQKGNLSKYENL